MKGQRRDTQKDFLPSQGRSTNRIRFKTNFERLITYKPCHFLDLKVILLTNDETLLFCENFLRSCCNIKAIIIIIIIIIFNSHFHSTQQCIKTFKRTFTEIMAQRKSSFWPLLCCKWILKVLRDAHETVSCDFRKISGRLRQKMKIIRTFIWITCISFRKQAMKERAEQKAKKREARQRRRDKIPLKYLT